MTALKLPEMLCVLPGGSQVHAQGVAVMRLIIRLTHGAGRLHVRDPETVGAGAVGLHPRQALLQNQVGSS